VPTAWVTGANGFVGVNLVAALLERGWRVIALHRAGSDLRYLSRFPCERRVGDVTDPGSVREALPRGVDVVFHVAGDTNLWSRRNAAQTRINVDGTRNVVAAALAAGAGRLVHTSSIAAYGIHDRPVDEGTPENASRSWIHYLRTKALAEREVRAGIERGLDAVIVNPANVVGPYDVRNWSTILWLAARGKLPGAPPGCGSFCHVETVAEAHVAAAERGRTGSNYLLGGADATYLEMVGIAGELTGRAVPRRPTPAWALRVLARAAVVAAAVTGRTPLLTPEKAALTSASMRCDSGRAIRELGFRPVPLRTMMADCHRWMVAEGRVPGPVSPDR